MVRIGETPCVVVSASENEVECCLGEHARLSKYSFPV